VVKNPPPPPKCYVTGRFCPANRPRDHRSPFVLVFCIKVKDVFVFGRSRGRRRDIFIVVIIVAIVLPMLIEVVVDDKIVHVVGSPAAAAAPTAETIVIRIVGVGVHHGLGSGNVEKISPGRRKLFLLAVLVEHPLFRHNLPPFAFDFNVLGGVDKCTYEVGCPSGPIRLVPAQMMFMFANDVMFGHGSVREDLHLLAHRPKIDRERRRVEINQSKRRRGAEAFTQRPSRTIHPARSLWI
jgi:hypothetical protein